MFIYLKTNKNGTYVSTFKTSKKIFIILFMFIDYVQNKMYLHLGIILYFWC